MLARKPLIGWRLWWVGLVCVTLVTTAAPPPAAAATFTVDRTDDDASATACSDLVLDDCSLRGAIIAANAAAGADTIVVPAGVYTLTLAGATATTGDLDITAGPLTIQGAGADVTIIQGCAPAPPATSCLGIDRIFDIAVGSVRIAIHDVTIRFGNVGSNNGGGINASGDFHLVDSVLTQNRGSQGAGILSLSGTVTLTRSAVVDNVGECHGAGLLTGGLLTVTDSTIAGNTAGGSCSGGGFFAGALEMTNSTVSGNTGGSGGGGAGGGMIVTGAATITSSTISGNTSGTGGGILVNGNTTTLVNVTITDNTATAGNGGGVSAGAAATVNLTSTVIAGNREVGTGSGPDCAGTLTSLGHNVIGTTTGCTVAATTGDQFGVDPMLGPLADNGGPTQTHLPLDGSPLIGNGDAATCPALDQRGVARSGTCEVGAAEFDAPATALDHFLCYKAKTARGAAAFIGTTVTLADEFDPGGRTFDVKKTTALCNPANKNNEGVVDADTHLKATPIKPRPAQAPVTAVAIVNQFHPAGAELTLDLGAPDLLLVPTAKSLTGPVAAPDPGAHAVDHFKCYKAKVSKGAPKFPKGVQALVEDQFSAARLVDVKKPMRLCTPADKNGEGIKASHLLACYQVKALVASVPRTGVHTTNQLGPEQLDVRKEEALCVPSVRAGTVVATAALASEDAEPDAEDDLDDDEE